MSMQCIRHKKHFYNYRVLQHSAVNCFFETLTSMSRSLLHFTIKL